MSWFILFITKFVVEYLSFVYFLPAILRAHLIFEVAMIARLGQGNSDQDGSEACDAEMKSNLGDAENTLSLVMSYFFRTQNDGA